MTTSPNDPTYVILVLMIWCLVLFVKGGPKNPKGR